MATFFKVSAITKDSVNELVKNGMIKEKHLQIRESVFNTFSIIDEEYVPTKSFKSDTMFDMPKYTFSNDTERFVVWGTTLLNAIVLKDYTIKTKPIEKGLSLPVYFRDEFSLEFPNAKTVDSFREPDGSIQLRNRYKIVGAVIARSPIFKDRWPVSYKMYEGGTSFLEFEKLRTNDATLRFVKEERLIELSKCDKIDRTYKGPLGPVTLTAYADLKIMANADNDPRWANAQFIVEQLADL